MITNARFMPIRKAIIDENAFEENVDVLSDARRHDGQLAMT